MNLSAPGRASLPLEWPAAVALALALGLLVALQPLFALVAVVMAALGLALALARISLAAQAIGAVVLGNLVTGQFYVLGLLPESFPVVLDLVLAGVFVAVALRPHPRSPRSHVATVAFFTLAALSVLNPLVPSLDYAAFGLRQVLMPLVALLVVKEAELSRRDIRFILAMLLLGWIVNLTIALRQWLFGFSGEEIAWTRSLASTYLVDGQIRLMGATQSNQDFGFLAAIAVPAVTACFLAAQQRVLRIAFGVLAVLSFAVLFGTLLRSTLVGGVAGAVVTAVLVSTVNRRPERVLAYAGGLAGVLVVLALVAPGRFLPEEKVVTLSERVASIFSPGSDASFQQRGTEVWPKSLRIISENPLGGGPGSSGPLSQARPLEAPFGSNVPDNGYLLMAVQFGWVGVIAFAGMLLTWLGDLVGWVRRGQTAAAAAAGVVVAAMVSMIAGSYWALVNPSVALGVLVGLGLRGDGNRGPLRALSGRHPLSTDAPPGARRPLGRLPVMPAPSGAATVGPFQPREAARPPRLLVVAAPMISAGGVYSYLGRVLPEISRRGWETGLLWAARTPVDPLPASWDRQVPEGDSLRTRQGQLQQAVRSAVEAWRPDLVLSMLPQSDVACARVRREIGIPWVAMLHGSPWPRRGEMAVTRRVAWRATVSTAYSRADGLLSVSRAVADEIGAALALRSPIINVGSGVDLPERTRKPRAVDPTVGFLGRLSHEKAPDIFLQIARLLPARARIFGDGPLSGMVAAAAAQHPQLEYRGWVDRDAALEEIDLLVVPSRREALPLAVLEAGAHSICTVARDVGGINEVLGLDRELTEHCLLPEASGPRDFAAAIRPLLEDPDQREQLGVRLHAVVHEHFALPRHVDRLLFALEPIVARAGTKVR